MKIEFSNVRKCYGSSCVLDIPSLTIESGSITGFFGYNGAGKSTLLSILSGLDTQFDGEVLYDGKTLDAGIASDVTCVFQRAQMLRRSVRGNIAYPLKLRGVPKKERIMRADAVMNDLEIMHLAQRHAWQLSGGEQQKTALARALIIRPKLLILDEASASMDRPSVKRFENEICACRSRTGATICMVTHSLSQAERLCDRIVYMDRGRVLTRDEVL